METVYPPEYHEARKSWIAILEDHDKATVDGFNAKFSGSLQPSQKEYEELYKYLRSNATRDLCMNALVCIEMITVPKLILTKEEAKNLYFVTGENK